MENTALFIGHSHLSREETIIPKLDQAMEALIDQGYSTFLCGGYGAFDFLCAQRLSLLKKQKPELQSILVHPYPRPHLSPSVLALFDETLYPGLENRPPHFAISFRNRWMVEQSQAAICYIAHDWGGAAKTYEYAGRRHLALYNLAVE